MDDFIFNTLNLEKLLSVENFKLRDLKFPSSIKFSITTARDYILYKPQLDLDKYCKNIDFLFFKYQERDDYNKLFLSIFNSCKKPKDIILLKIVKKFNISFIGMFFKYIKLLLRLCKKNSFNKSLILYMKTIFFIQCLKEFKTITFKNLVIFSDAQPLENLFVQYSNYQQLNTISLQHGLYIDYEDPTNINSLNYTEIQSKIVLVWGESTSKLMLKYNPKLNVVTCGKPVINLENKSSVNTEIIFGIICDQTMYYEYNLEMIDIALSIANKLNKKIIVRLHPLDKISKYPNNKNIIYDNNLSSAAYIIAHTSSLMFELLALGYIVYKYKSDINCNEIPQNMLFSTDKELEEILNRNDKSYVSDNIHIKAIKDESMELYSDFFNMVTEGK